LAVAIAVVSVGMVSGVGVAQAAETTIACGQVVSGAIKVANDLVCTESDGLIVGSSDTVIDLNGHKITCVGAGYQGSCQGIAMPVTTPDQEPEDGVFIEGHTNVRVFTSVPGGTLSGFDNGIRMERVSNIKIEFLTITGPPSLGAVNPRPFSHGILIRGSNCPNEDGNIHLGTGENSGNDLSNANQGIAINGSCVHVVHNRIHHNNSNFSVPSNGILLNNASENVVRGNEVFMNGDPIDVADEVLGGDGGITMRNLSRFNHITNNVVSENFGDGISVRSGSEDNKIDNNSMFFNGLNSPGVFFDAAGKGAPGGPPGSSPLNQWNENNQCLTQNEEVPPGTCEPDDVPPGEG
jgi:parallel beta-helix repeat protein